MLKIMMKDKLGPLLFANFILFVGMMLLIISGIDLLLHTSSSTHLTFIIFATISEITMILCCVLMNNNFYLRNLIKHKRLIANPFTKVYQPMGKMNHEMISNVMQELRTPLTSIHASIGLVISGAMGELAPESTKLLKLANENCERISQMMNNLLDSDVPTSGIMTFHRKHLDINEIVEQAVSRNQLFAEKHGVSVTLVQSKVPLIINADPNHLMQVLDNFISNAIQFSPKNAAVTINVAAHQEKARFCISNRGPGIPKDFHSHIFQGFFQVKKVEKIGTGSGLYISKMIIEKMGGVMGYFSIPNEITTFYFDLPLSLTSINPVYVREEARLES